MRVHGRAGRRREGESGPGKRGGGKGRDRDGAAGQDVE